MRWIILTTALTMALAAAPATAADNDSVIGHQYVLTRVDGAAFTSEREVFVEFGEGYALSGRVCNAFRTPASYQNGILKAGAIAATRMLCPDRGLSQLEATLFRALEAGVSAVRVDDRLELRRDASVWEFTRAAKKDAQPQPPAAAAAEAQSAVDEDALAGRKFVLSRVDGEAFSVNMGTQPFVAFEREEGAFRIHGSACNNFMGPAAVADGKLTVTNVASTMKMCIDSALSGYERDFHQTLNQGVAVTLDGGTLTLSGGGRTFEYREE